MKCNSINIYSLRGVDTGTNRSKKFQNSDIQKFRKIFEIFLKNPKNYQISPKIHGNPKKSKLLNAKYSPKTLINFPKNSQNA
jgi:hypothetical protein